MPSHCERTIAALPEVEQIENIRYVDVPYRGDSVAVSGADMRSMVTRSSGAIIGGNKKTLDDSLPRGEGVLVSRNFVTRWRIKIGANVHLDTPAGPLDMQLIVAVMVAVVGIANTLIISVAERKREFGIIRSIGGYQGQIRNTVLFEAFAISVVGVIVGMVGALFNIQFMSHTVSTILAGYDVPFYFPWRLILETFPAVVAVSLMAGWVPASHAMRTSVIEAIGHE